MIRAFAGRLMAFAATLSGAVGLVLLLLAAAPGDPIDVLPDADALRPRLEAEWHLDRPLPERYLRMLIRVLSGDLGTSTTYRPGLPVATLIAGPAARSFGWAMGALFLALAWGTALAGWTVGGRRRGAALAQVVSIAPVFLLTHLAVAGLNEVAFALLRAGWIARPTWFALPDQPSLVRTTLATVILAVGSGTLVEVHQSIETALSTILRSGYVDAARARGAPIWPHVARNIVGPVATIAASRAASLLGGLVVIEKVLLLNGAGAILWQAAELRDYDVATGITVLAAAFVAGIHLVADMVRIGVDPRERAL